MSSSDIILLDGSNDSASAAFEQCTSKEAAAEEHGQQQQMSKTQRKKRERMERYILWRKERRQKHRERIKERKRTDKANGKALTASGTGKPTKLYTVHIIKRSQFCGDTISSVYRIDSVSQFEQMNESKCRVRVAVDMAYDELMDQRTVSKTVSQLRHCYAANRRAANPLQFYVVNLDGKAKKILDGIAGCQQWDVHLMGHPLDRLWDDREIVYLTADSENVLNELDEQKVYVIGGLLDHNHLKGTCLGRANGKGYAHAKLPIGDFVEMSSRKVLAINHVFEILLHFARDHDWERAFLAVIPKRKLPQLVEVVEMAGTESKDKTPNSDEEEDKEQRGNTDGNDKHDDAGDGEDGVGERVEDAEMDETDRQEMSRMIDQIDEHEEEEGGGAIIAE